MTSVLKVAEKAVVTPELSFTVPPAENETPVPAEFWVRINGDPANAEQAPPVVPRPAQFKFDDPGPMVASVNCAWGSAGITKKFGTGKVNPTFCSVAVLPLNVAKAPVLVPRSTVFGPPNEKKLAPLEGGGKSERDVEPIRRMS